LKWLGVGRTIVLSELSNAQRVREILWVHKVPHSWILSRLIAFQARNWFRPWAVKLAYLGTLALWQGGSLLLSSWNAWIGLVWFLIPTIYVLYVLTELIKFVKMKTSPKTKG